MKKALLIEINYKKTEFETKNEVSIENVGKMLKERFLYEDLEYLKEDSENLPTKENIMDALQRLHDKSANCEEIWIHYMGNSTVMIDEKNEYCDRGIVPLDHHENGYIFDNELKKLFTTFKCKLYLFLDCCYGNYGFNIGHSLKMVEGKFIKEDNKTPFLFTENQNTIYAVSMYMGPHKNKKHLEKKYISNLLSRRFVQLMQSEAYKTTIDKLVVKMFKRLYEDFYYLQTMVLSSNKPIDGATWFVTNKSGNKDKLNINFNIRKTEMEIEKEKEIQEKLLNDPQFKDILGGFNKNKLDNRQPNQNTNKNQISNINSVRSNTNQYSITQTTVIPKKIDTNNSKNNVAIFQQMMASKNSSIKKTNNTETITDNNVVSNVQNYSKKTKNNKKNNIIHEKSLLFKKSQRN